jgi:hypothetical protein
MQAVNVLRPPRRLRSAPFGLAALVVLLQLGAAPLAAKAPPKETQVLCAQGDSINQALGHPGNELVIYITGICTEDVVVDRDRVKLLGTDPAVDGIRAATIDDPYGAALYIRGGRQVTVENLQLTGGKHAGLAIEDVRRSTILRNLRIEGNQEVGLQASNSLVVGFGLSITGNGIAGVGLSETAYLRCDDCTIADNPSAGSGFGIVGSAGALATLFRGSISAGIPLSFRFNSVVAAHGTTLSGYVALDASGSSSITVKGATVDGSIRADGDSQIELSNSQQVFNPVPGGNVVSGASEMTVSARSVLIGETVFDEFSNGFFNQSSTLETLACSTGSDAVCMPGVTKSSSNCPSCP